MTHTIVSKVTFQKDSFLSLSRHTVLKYTLILVAVLFISTACKSAPEIPGTDIPAPPGLATMKKYGRKLSPLEILSISADSMREMGIFGDAQYRKFTEKLNEYSEKKVFKISGVEFTKEGYAKNIRGAVITPENFREYVALGGMGIPLYEAVEPNEFGVVFGRKANIAVRDGAIVRINPLEYSDLYYVELESEMYDAIMRASVLFQAYEMVRKPYIDNLRVELEGMIMNSESRTVILEDIKKFKEEHKNEFATDSELMIAFMNANTSYLEALSESNKEALQRIEESAEFLVMIKEAAETASGRVAFIFAEIAKDITLITLQTAGNALSRGDSSPVGIALAAIEAAALTAEKTAEYIRRNVPKNSRMNMIDLQNINHYTNYMFQRYLSMTKKNTQAENEAQKVIRGLKSKGAL